MTRPLLFGGDGDGADGDDVAVDAGGDGGDDNDVDDDNNEYGDGGDDDDDDDDINDDATGDDDKDNDNKFVPFNARSNNTHNVYDSYQMHIIP